MSKLLKIGAIALMFLVFSAFGVHKFYVGMFQLEFVAHKKEIQITTRLFIDDVNVALEKKYSKKTFIAEAKESKEDQVFLQNYIAENFKIKINNQPKSFVFLSKEVDNNVLVCYFKIKDIPKVNSLQIENSIMMELFSEQQNIIQFNNNGKKSSLLLTSETTAGTLK